MTYYISQNRKNSVLYFHGGGTICQDNAHFQSLSGLKNRLRWRGKQGSIRLRTLMWFERRPFSLLPKALKTNGSERSWEFPAKLSANGESVFSKNAWPVWRIAPAAAGPAFFPPEVVLQVKAIACELPSKWGLPFSRFSHDDIAQEAIRQEIVASISGTTVWRWLSADAIKPWSFRSWIFPRDPLFLQKASPILDLYQGFWEGIPLGPADYVISADEKTSIQCRERLHPSLPSIPGQSRRVEFEYERGGAVSYLAAWDVHRAKLFGLCEDHTGIDPFHHLVDLVMQQEPYKSAHRVFWITDNGSSHRGKPAIQRLSEWYPQARQIHTPVHASWLNQIEIYFSIVQRKVLTPNDFSSLADLQKQIMDFQQYYEIIAKPFQWKFTGDDLKRTLSRLSSENIQQEKVAA
jgi:hypothetical protein